MHFETLCALSPSFSSCNVVNGTRLRSQIATAILLIRMKPIQQERITLKRCFKSTQTEWNRRNDLHSRNTHCSDRLIRSGECWTDDFVEGEASVLEHFFDRLRGDVSSCFCSDYSHRHKEIVFFASFIISAKYWRYAVVAIRDEQHRA